MTQARSKQVKNRLWALLTDRKLVHESTGSTPSAHINIFMGIASSNWSSRTRTQRFKIQQDILDTDRTQIKQQLDSHKISQMQLDPYGFCNAGCWFCPVKYRGNPASGQQTMSVELLEKIIEDVIAERTPSGLVSVNFQGFYTAHYNEILLYRHFEHLLRICLRHHLSFVVLSNGVPLTPDKVDLILAYPGVVNGICLNIPAFEPELWSRRSGINISQFPRLINNINYARQQLTSMREIGNFTIQINGATDLSFTDHGGWLEPGPDFPSDMDLDPEQGELQTQQRLAQQLFPDINSFTVPHLIDRAGHLSSVMSNRRSVVEFLQKGEQGRSVVGCNNGHEVGDRPFGWLHVNALGQAFLCCNDYDMQYVIGDFNTTRLRDFWGSEHHVDRILSAYRSICRNCDSARFQSP